MVGKNEYPLHSKEVREAIVDAAKRTPAYKKIEWDEEKQNLLNSLTWFDLHLLKFFSIKNSIKESFSKHTKAWKTAYKIWLVRHEIFPVASVPNFEDPDDSDAGLIKFLGRYGFQSDGVDADPITIEAHIENHATGKVASAAYGQEIGLDESVKIVSYTVIPGKSLDVTDDDFIRPSGGFVYEGCIPPDVEFSEDESYRRFVKI